MGHQCKRGELDWYEGPVGQGDCVVYRGRCPVCGREYEQVFTESEELWDVEKEEYVGRML